MQPDQKAKYLPLLELDSIQAISSEFLLGKLVTTPERDNDSNQAFAFETESGKYYLKSYAKSEHDPDQFLPLVQREIAFVKYLEQERFPTAHYLTFQPFLFNGKLATVTTSLSGNVLSEDLLSVETLDRIGALVAQLHNTSATYGQVGAKVVYRNSYRDTVNDTITDIEQVLNIPRSEFIPLLDTYQTLREQSETTYSHLPKGLIHSDITPGNLLLAAGSRLALIDFEGLRFAPFIFDFGQAVTTLAWKDGTFNKKFVASFFNAYQKVRSLSSEEKSLIPAHLIYHYLHKLEWRLSVLLNKPGYIPIVKEQMAQARTFIEQAEHII